MAKLERCQTNLSVSVGFSNHTYVFSKLATAKQFLARPPPEICSCHHRFVYCSWIVSLCSRHHFGRERCIRVWIELRWLGFAQDPLLCRGPMFSRMTHPASCRRSGKTGRNARLEIDIWFVKAYLSSSSIVSSEEHDNYYPCILWFWFRSLWSYDRWTIWLFNDISFDDLDGILLKENGPANLSCKS